MTVVSQECGSHEWSGNNAGPVGRETLRNRGSASEHSHALAIRGVVAQRGFGLAVDDSTGECLMHLGPAGSFS